MQTCPLLPSSYYPFHPLPLLANRHLQTIFASQFYLPLEPPSTTLYLHLTDGDQLALEISTPVAWHDWQPTVILVHGLCGCHRSPYMMRMARKLWQRGVRVCRMNLRGCGSGQDLARMPYHSGRSDDVRAVVDHVVASTPDSPLHLIGFSLGGNLALKYAGELSHLAPAPLSQVIAICPPVDLAICSRMLSMPHNRLYELHFVRLLKAHVQRRHARFPDLPHIELPPHLSLYRFDNLYIAPMCGFRDADDYYTRCSSARYVESIALPCRMLFARDDPFIDYSCLLNTCLPEHIQVTITERGGHLGFLGIPHTKGGYRWLDHLLLDWLNVA